MRKRKYIGFWKRWIMRVNRDSLSARASNIAKEKGISANVVYSRYFFDCFLKRLSVSPYAEKFVLKGGLLLSSLFGIENRVTMDIDFIVRRIRMERETIVGIMKEICEEKTDDNVSFRYIGNSEIKKDDVYGGFSVSIEGRLENVRQRFDIDLATGDPVYPSDQNYEYRCLVTGETLRLKSYSVESVVAEKLETFLSRGPLNSRAKDLYDLYVLERIIEKNSLALKEAFMETCRHRKFETDREKAAKTFESVSSSPMQRKSWDSYSRKTGYAKQIAFDDVVDSIGRLIEIVI